MSVVDCITRLAADLVVCGAATGNPVCSVIVDDRTFRAVVGSVSAHIVDEGFDRDAWRTMQEVRIATPAGYVTVRRGVSDGRHINQAVDNATTGPIRGKGEPWER